ncbi:hypothetical protein V6N12_031320 [Hibiscus sabdariffa]|uniref:Uncharacterized protein n=1 Tax=Hibiscus sabdariffa TaxID=183260 RepID=A0ABR2EAQ5_9ROSI
MSMFYRSLTIKNEVIDKRIGARSVSLDGTCENGSGSSKRNMVNAMSKSLYGEAKKDLSEDMEKRASHLSESEEVVSRVERCSDGIGGKPLGAVKEP